MEFILDKIIIEGGNTRLEGEVIIEGAKNCPSSSCCDNLQRKEKQF